MIFTDEELKKIGSLARSFSEFVSEQVEKHELLQKIPSRLIELFIKDNDSNEHDFRGAMEAAKQNVEAGKKEIALMNSIVEKCDQTRVKNEVEELCNGKHN